MRDSRQGLNAKLIRTHLSIAIIGVLFLSLSFFFFTWLKQTQIVLTQIDVPIVQATASIQTNLQKSLAALRAWVTIDDPKFQTIRINAWEKGIQPSLNKLNQLAVKSGDKEIIEIAHSIKSKLVDLKTWQWHIENIARTEGNNPRKVIVIHQLQPEAIKMLDMSRALLLYERMYPDSKGQVRYQKLSQFVEYLLQALAELKGYVLTMSPSLLENVDEKLKLAHQALLAINISETTPVEFKEQMEPLQLRLLSFTKLVLQLHAHKNNAHQQVSSEWLAVKSDPIALDIHQSLDRLMQIEMRNQSTSMNKVNYFASNIVYIVLLLILMLIILSYYLAKYNAKAILKPINLLIDASNKLITNKLKDEITVDNDDEIGDLTKSFNKMFLQIKLTEEKLTQIVQTAVDPILTIDEKGIIQSANSATETLLGYSDEELIGENVTVLMPDPYKSEHDQYLKNYLSTKVKKIIGVKREVTARKANGETIPIQLSVSEVKVGSERLFAGIIRDISSEKDQEEKMGAINAKLEYENKQRSISQKLDDHLRTLNNLNDFTDKMLQFLAEHFDVLLSMFYEVDDSEKHIKLLSGYGYKERRDRKTEFRWGESLVGECAKSKKMIVISELPYDYFKISSGVGESLPKHILVLPLIFEKKVLGVIEICRLKAYTDVDKDFLQALCHNISINYNILSSKVKLEKLFRQTEEQRQYLQQQEEELRSSNEELESQTSAVKASEEELRTINDELHKQLSVIEEQKAALKSKSEEFEKVSKYKTEFLANMSHELRTPLNSLLILAQSFMANKEGNLSSEQKEESKIIYEAGCDLLTLINDILDISKVEAGKLTIEMDEVCIEDIVLSVTNQFNPIADKNGVELVIDHKNCQTMCFQSDQLRLLQILKNLLSNAFKFTSDGSVTFKMFTDDKKIYFRVIDTGIGIANEKLDLVFSEFQQADGSTSRKYGGTGLGVSISKKLAELMKGSLTLTSQVGKGSEFTLSLPLISAVSDSGQVKSNLNQSAFSDEGGSYPIQLPADIIEIPNELNDDRDFLSPDKPCLLLIDDDATLCQTMGKVIRDNNSQILIGLTAKVGLQLAAAYKPSGILLDLGLPDTGGEEVLAILKSDERTATIPVHIVSGQDKTSDYASKGALSFLQKPVSQQDIERLVCKISDHDKNRVLIVEDDRVVQKGLLEVFTAGSEAIEVDFAETAKEAKQILKVNDYSCVVVDLGLPDESGILLIKELVEMMNILVPIIVYTARELTEEEYKRVRQYTNKVVIKGIQASERLLDEITLFLNHIEEENDLVAELPQIASIERSFNDKTVLLVDDDLRNTFALSRALEAEGFKVIIADNGKLAIDKYQHEKNIDIILMDMMMPVMDGYEAMSEIRSLKGGRNIPIIALTAKATKKDREQCIEAGANDYMSKPISVPSLLELIGLWLNNKRDDS